jgi:hypothetical protein
MVLTYILAFDLNTVRSASPTAPLQDSIQENEIMSMFVDGNISVTGNTTASDTNPRDSPSTSPMLISSIPPMKYSKHIGQRSPRPSPLSKRRVRAHSFNHQLPPGSNSENNSNTRDSRRTSFPSTLPRSQSDRLVLLSDSINKAKSKDALRVNDSMVYLDGPQVYTCAQCRTHMTSHDDIISKSFHGRHGRAYLFDQCVNVTIGPSEDRRLITGMHSVSDIFCKRCKSLVGWTYLKAYESSQKYKEGKYIIEKINLHLEESDYYTVAPPAGERIDRWRQRSMSWGDNETASAVQNSTGGDQSTRVIYEYRPSQP